MAVKPKLVALNLCLLAGLLVIIWQGRAKWREAQAERQSSLNVPVKPVVPPPSIAAQKPDAVQAAKYADVAAKDLFAKDRNPTVIVEAPKVEAPKPMPPLPVVYGVLSLPSGIKAIMSDRAGGLSKSVHSGDTVGDFKIAALDTRKVTFEWEGKQIERNIDDLLDRSGGTTPTNAASSGPAAPPPQQAAAAQTPSSASMGNEIKGAESPSRECKGDDKSPVGTVVDGYKKVGAETPFGLMGCRWVQSK